MTPIHAQVIAESPSPLPLDEPSNSNVSISEIGASVLRKEADALSAIVTQLEIEDSDLHKAFTQAVNEIVDRRGRVAVSGMGKSGHIGRKIAATLASTGTPAFFVHPAEAGHGDLGMIMPGDVVIALSNSGKSPELGAVIKYTKRFGMPLIAITSNKQSPLGKAADIALVLPKVPEACILGLAPTTSTTMTLALGDALAVAVMQMKGFTSTDFGKYHPSGSLGNLLQLVSEIMHQGHEMPLVHKDDSMNNVRAKMNEAGSSCLGVMGKRSGKLIGVITDSDLRRHSHNITAACKKTANSIMTRKPQTIKPYTLTAEAMRVIDELGVAQLFVTDEKQRPIGIVRIHDLLKAGVA